MKARKSTLQCKIALMHWRPSEGKYVRVQGKAVSLSVPRGATTEEVRQLALDAVFPDGKSLRPVYKVG